MSNKLFAIKQVSAVFLLLAPLCGRAAVLQGAVTGEDGQAVAGAMVTLWSADKLLGETGYTDGQGRFVLQTAQSGKLSVRVRKAYFPDADQDVQLKAADRRQLNVVLKKFTSEQELSDTLSASAHFAKIPWAGQEQRKRFQVRCLTCHQVGNAFTRTPRTIEHWQQILPRMLGFLGIKDSKLAEFYAETLFKSFDGQPVKAEQLHPVDPEIFRVKITQWKLPRAVIAHDTEVNQRDGKLYTVDEGTDQILITDTKTNVTEAVKFSDNGLPVGGRFAQLGLGIPFGLAVQHGPHSLQERQDGKYYLTNAVGGELGLFDPKTRRFEYFPVGDRSLYPHTVRIDREGIAWFTIAFSNQLGRFDPRTKKLTVIDLPTATNQPDNPVPSPYGIDINPIDGSVWYSKLLADKIGRVDPKTLQVQEFDPPLTGPRRLRFSRDGMLWIPAFGDGTLVRLDPRTMKYTAFRLPALAPNEVEAPYAVAIDPKTQDVWVTANMSDRMFRFIPREQRFVSYPLPTRGIYLRDITFTKDGRVCTPSSPMPATPAVVEGGMQEILCLSDGNRWRSARGK